jgi:hypothetical protein
VARNGSVASCRPHGGPGSQDRTLHYPRHAIIRRIPSSTSPMLYWWRARQAVKLLLWVQRILVPPASRSTIFGRPVLVLITQSTRMVGNCGRSLVVMTISVAALARASPRVTPRDIRRNDRRSRLPGGRGTAPCIASVARASRAAGSGRGRNARCRRRQRSHRPPAPTGRAVSAVTRRGDRHQPVARAPDESDCLIARLGESVPGGESKDAPAPSVIIATRRVSMAPHHPRSTGKVTKSTGRSGVVRKAVDLRQWRPWSNDLSRGSIVRPPPEGRTPSRDPASGPVMGPVIIATLIADACRHARAEVFEQGKSIRRVAANEPACPVPQPSILVLLDR